MDYKLEIRVGIKEKYDEIWALSRKLDMSVSTIINYIISNTDLEAATIGIKNRNRKKTEKTK